MNKIAVMLDNKRSSLDKTKYKGTFSGKIHVGSIEEAAALCRFYIKAYNLKEYNWIGGKLTDVETNDPIGKIDYYGMIKYTNGGVGRAKKSHYDAIDVILADINFNIISLLNEQSANEVDVFRKDSGFMIDQPFFGSPLGINISIRLDNTETEEYMVYMNELYPHNGERCVADKNREFAFSVLHKDEADKIRSVYAETKIMTTLQMLQDALLEYPDNSDYKSLAEAITDKNTSTIYLGGDYSISTLENGTVFVNDSGLYRYNAKPIAPPTIGVAINQDN